MGIDCEGITAVPCRKREIGLEPSRLRGTIAPESRARSFCRAGPVAQWLEPAAHNRLVGGSSPSGPTIYLWLQMIAAWLAMRFARLAVRMVRCDMVFTTRPCLGHLRSAHGMLAKLSASEINALWKPYRRSRCEVQVIQFAGFISHPALSACPDEISSAIDHRCAAKSNFAGHAGQACLLLQIERFDM